MRKKEFAIVTIHGTRAFADLHNVASRYLPLAPTNSCRFRVLPISCTLGHPLVNWTFRSLELLVSLDLYFIGHGVHALALPKPSHYLYLFFAVFRFRRDTSLMFFSHTRARLHLFAVLKPVSWLLLFGFLCFPLFIHFGFFFLVGVYIFAFAHILWFWFSFFSLRDLFTIS